MKRLTCVLLVLMCAVCVSGEPLYRAGQSASASRWLHGEISGGYIFTDQSLQDHLGQFSSSSLRGWTARALWTPLPWLSAGAEYARLGDVSLKSALVDKYTLSRAGAVVKFTLSPNTNPRFYILGGLGKSTHRLTTALVASDYKKSQNYWKAALGLEADIYKGIFAAAEGELLWYETDDLETFYQLSSRREMALYLRAGVRL